MYIADSKNVRKFIENHDTEYTCTRIFCDDETSLLTVDYYAGTIEEDAHEYEMWLCTQHRLTSDKDIVQNTCYDQLYRCYEEQVRVAGFTKKHEALEWIKAYTVI